MQNKINSIKHIGRRFLIISLAFILITISLILEPKSFVLSINSHDIKVYVESPIKSYEITQKYIKDIKKMPKYLQQNISSISIEELDLAYTVRESFHLDNSSYISDVVEHEAIHVLDNATNATANKKFKKCLKKDRYIINDSYDEIFVTIMFYYLNDKNDVKENLPTTYKYIQMIIKKAVSN